MIPFAVVHDGLHRRGAFLGVLGAFHGAGAIAGGLGAGKFIGRVGEVRSLALALALGAGGMASYAFATVASALLASLLFGCCLAGVIVQLDDADPAEHADASCSAAPRPRARRSPPCPTSPPSASARRS